MNARSLISKGFVAVARSEDEMLERSGAGQSSLVRCECLSETAGGEPAGTLEPAVEWLGRSGLCVEGGEWALP